VFIQMAGGLGGFVADAFPWKNYEAFLKESMGDQWRTLNKKGMMTIDHSLPEPLAFSFNTASAHFEFYPTARSTARADVSPLPRFTPAALEGDPNRFKLTLIPYDAMRLAGGDTANAPFLTKTVDDTVLKQQTGFVEINPATARTLGLKEGDAAKLATPKGEARVRVHLFEGIMPDVISMPRGLGHSAYSKYLSGKGVNINALMGYTEDPTSGLDMAWGVRASLTRA
jgi:anaerobic selenocysteine-containing dehydrogenase